MESAGARLKKLRLEKGISLDEVHKKTKIHLSILRAIEEDSLMNFSPVYIKGFLKMYCKFLGVDPKEFILDYKEPQGTLYYEPAAKEKPTTFLKDIPLKLDYFKVINIKVVKKVLAVIIIFILFSFGLFKLGKFIASHRSTVSKKTIASSNVNTAKKLESTRVEKIIPVSVITLGIYTKEDCWIYLKTDGKLVFQGTLNKGRRESWKAREKIELSLGNAGAVELEVNGQAFKNLGRRNQARKNIIITKEGLNFGR